MKLLLATPLKLALALAACGLITSTHAAERLAAPPEFLSTQAGSAMAGARWQAVDDDVLSHQTGKAPGAEMVSGVVLDLMSQWQMPNGGSATAHGKLTISTNADNTLSAQVSTSAQANDGAGHGNHYGNNPGNAPLATATTTTTAAANATPATTASTGTGANPQASATGGQNVSINGVSQVNQVAGNGNTSSNSAVIDFNGSSPTTLAATGAATTTNSPSAQATSASGNVRASVTFGNGGVALTLQTPSGVASQTISPAAVQGSGSIAQWVQVAGNAQAVVNQLQLSVQTHAMSGALLRQLGVLQAMQNAALLRR
jgi:hypothetical protein